MSEDQCAACEECTFLAFLAESINFLYCRRGIPVGVLSGPGHCETSSPPSPSVLNTHKFPKIVDVSTEIFHQKHFVTIT